MKWSRHPPVAHLSAVGLVLIASTLGAVIAHFGGIVSGPLACALIAMLGGAELQKRWP